MNLKKSAANGRKRCELRKKGAPCRDDGAAVKSNGKEKQTESGEQQAGKPAVQKPSEQL